MLPKLGPTGVGQRRIAGMGQPVFFPSARGGSRRADFSASRSESVTDEAIRREPEG